MNAASHMPSGVLIATSVSVTGIAAADADPLAATMPAATDMAMKSRRERSLVASSLVSKSCFSSIMARSLLVSDVLPNFGFIVPSCQTYARHARVSSEDHSGKVMPQFRARGEAAHERLCVADSANIQRSA